jgi:putative hydrolase of HD superfamily
LSVPDERLDSLLAVLSDAGRLKTLRRAGWVRAGVAEPESVADHSYRLAMLALLVALRLDLDVDRLVRLTLLHDLAEARVGDLTPADRVAPAVKAAQEDAAFSEIVGGLPEAPTLVDLWREYETGHTPEARIAHQLDKLEMALQALEYEQAMAIEQGSSHLRPGWADEFFTSARAGLAEPLLIELYDRIVARRPSPMA